MRNISLVFYTIILALVSNAAFGNPVIDKYDLELSFDFKQKKLFCKAELSLNHIVQNDTLNLLLYRLLKVTSVKDESGAAIQFNQHVSSFSDWEALQVNCISVYIGGARPYKAKQKLTVEYEGLLLGYTETGMSYVKDNIDPTFTLLRTDCFAYPVQGTTSWEQNTAAGFPYFDYSISVTVPDTLSVVNGGQLVSKNSRNGFTEFIYKNVKPAWRIDVAIGKYSTIAENGFSVYYFPVDSTGAEVVAEAVKKTYALFSRWFGEVPFAGYSIIEIPDNWGSQTDVTCIIQAASAFKDKNRLYTLYHELSHVWNVTSLDKYPCRLESEGLAMFLQYLVIEKTDNRAGVVDSAATRMFAGLKRKLADDTVAYNTAIMNYGQKQLTDLSYRKGMLFFYLLYKSVGEAEFMEVIKGFYTLYRNKGATIDEFSTYLITRLKTKQVERLITNWIRTNISSQQILDSTSPGQLLQ